MACGGAEPASDSGTQGFCERTRPAVESFLSEAAAARPAPDDPRYGGTVVVSSVGELPIGLNGFGAEDYVSVQHQQFVGLMTLLQHDENLELKPYLAEWWEVASDTSRISFRLRDDVYWHDGERTDAYDVAFTYARLTDPETAYSNAAFFDHYVPGPEGIEVHDSLSFSVRIARPHAEFMDVWRAVSIMPEHLLADVPPAELKQHPIGTVCPVGNGPFAFVEHRQGESWTFRANPAFPEELGGRPYLDRYVFRVIPEPGTQLAELLTGRTDVYLNPPAEQIEEIESADDLAVEFSPTREYAFVGWNGRRPMLADARVRRALTMALDRRTVVEAITGGHGILAQTTVPPYHWAYDPDLEDALGYDPAGARELLDEAGWIDRDGDGVREDTDGNPLRITLKYNPGSAWRSQLAEITQAQLSQVGVDIDVAVVEWGTLVAQITSPEDRDFEGLVMGWSNEFKLDDTDLFHSDRIDTPYAFSGTRLPELDQLLDTLQQVVDREAAIPLWRRYQELLVEEQPFTFLNFRERVVGVNRRLQGAHMDVRGEWVAIKDWWIDPDHR